MQCCLRVVLRDEFVGKWVSCDGRIGLVEGIVYIISAKVVRVQLRTLGKSKVDRVVEFEAKPGGSFEFVRMAQRRLREMLVLRSVSNV